MAVDTRKIKLRRTTILYWSLLVYILAALLWWLISLENQNQRIRAEQLQLLELQASQLDPLEKERQWWPSNHWQAETVQNISVKELLF